MDTDRFKKWALKGVEAEIYFKQEQKERIHTEYGAKRQAKLDDLENQIKLLREEKEEVNQIKIREIF